MASLLPIGAPPNGGAGVAGWSDPPVRLPMPDYLLSHPCFRRRFFLDSGEKLFTPFAVVSVPMARIIP